MKKSTIDSDSISDKPLIDDQGNFVEALLIPVKSDFSGHKHAS